MFIYLFVLNFRNLQRVIGDLRGYSQSTVCHVICRVSVAFAERLHEYVHFPHPERDQIRNIQMFYEVAGFPHVAALIDGTLRPITNPGRVIAEIFRCRKGYFALNVLVSIIYLRYYKL